LFFRKGKKRKGVDTEDQRENAKGEKKTAVGHSYKWSFFLVRSKGEKGKKKRRGRLKPDLRGEKKRRGIYGFTEEGRREGGRGVPLNGEGKKRPVVFAISL